MREIQEIRGRVSNLTFENLDKWWSGNLFLLLCLLVGEEIIMGVI